MPASRGGRRRRTWGCEAPRTSWRNKKKSSISEGGKEEDVGKGETGVLEKAVRSTWVKDPGIEGGDSLSQKKGEEIEKKEPVWATRKNEWDSERNPSLGISYRKARSRAQGPTLTGEAARPKKTRPTLPIERRGGVVRRGPGRGKLRLNEKGRSGGERLYNREKTFRLWGAQGNQKFEEAREELARSNFKVSAKGRDSLIRKGYPRVQRGVTAFRGGKTVAWKKGKGGGASLLIP